MDRVLATFPPAVAKCPPPVVIARSDIEGCLRGKAVWCGDSNERVLRLPTVDAVLHRRLSTALAIMDQELGHAMDIRKDKDTQTLFYVDCKGRVLGMSVAERVDTAFLLEDDEAPTAPPGDGMSEGGGDDDDAEKGEPLRRQTRSQTKASTDMRRSSSVGSLPTVSPQQWAERAHACRSPGDTFQWCMCGISRIWVHNSARRRGIASRLLEVARENLVYGFVIPRKQVAFSQPTIDGKLFALHYTGTKQLMVY